MPENFYAILTNTGKAKIANAMLLNQKVDFNELALGDGGGIYVNPTENQTALVNEIFRCPIGAVTIDTNNSNWIVVETAIAAQTGGFMIREAGIYDSEGDLLAVAKYPETYKPALEEGSVKDLLIRMILEVTNASVVTLKVDPTVILATKKDLERYSLLTHNHDNLYYSHEEIHRYLQEKHDRVNDYIEYFVNPASGNDNNDGLTVETAFKTLAKACSMINHRYFVNGFKLSLAPGTYDKLELVGVSSPATCTITGGDSLSNAENYKVNTARMLMVDCFKLTVSGIKAEVMEDGGFFRVIYSKNVKLYNCIVSPEVPISTYGIVMVNSTSTCIEDCKISNMQGATAIAIEAQMSPGTFVKNCVGDNNNVAVRAVMGCNVHVYGTLPNYTGVECAYDYGGSITKGNIGGIHSRGSNANGEWIRFEDGTQICWSDMIIKLDSDSFQSKNFPATFSHDPSVSGSVNPIAVSGPNIWDDIHRISFSYHYGFSQAWTVLFRAPLFVSEHKVYLTAIGRWK